MTWAIGRPYETCGHRRRRRRCGECTTCRSGSIKASRRYGMLGKMTPLTDSWPCGTALIEVWFADLASFQPEISYRSQEDTATSTFWRPIKLCRAGPILLTMWRKSARQYGEISNTELTGSS